MIPKKCFHIIRAVHSKLAILRIEAKKNTMDDDDSSRFQQRAASSLGAAMAHHI